MSSEYDLVPSLIFFGTTWRWLRVRQPGVAEGKLTSPDAMRSTTPRGINATPNTKKSGTTHRHVRTGFQAGNFCCLKLEPSQERTIENRSAFSFEISIQKSGNTLTSRSIFLDNLFIFVVGHSCNRHSLSTRTTFQPAKAAMRGCCSFQSRVPPAWVHHQAAADSSSAPGRRAHRHRSQLSSRLGCSDSLPGRSPPGDVTRSVFSALNFSSARESDSSEEQ